MKEEFFTYTLSNGIRCILKQVKSPVCYCSMTIGAGTRDELSGEQGVAHLVEHTLFKGTARRKAYQVNCRLENFGGEINAFTTKEETVVHATVLKGDFAKAAELIGDIVFHSVFPESEVDKEKEVIFDEINMYKDSPDDRIYDEFEERIFSGSQLGHSILGTKSSLSKLHSAQIKAFMARTYTTDRMVFAAIGNISPKNFAATVERYLGPVDASVCYSERITPPHVEQFEKELNLSTHQMHTMLGTRAYSLNDDRRLPLIMLSNILGGPSAASRLNVALRERNALTYCVETSYTPLSDTGLFTLYFSCERDKQDACRKTVNEELRKIMEVPLTKRQLSIAKRQFIGQFAISAESNEAYMLGVGRSYLAFGSIDSVDEVYAKINRLSSEDIMNVARDILPRMSQLTYK